LFSPGRRCRWKVAGMGLPVRGRGAGRARHETVRGKTSADSAPWIIFQPMELMAINLNAYPCREIAMAERVTG